MNENIPELGERSILEIISEDEEIECPNCHRKHFNKIFGYNVCQTCYNAYIFIDRMLHPIK